MKRYLGSSIAIGLGILSLAGSLANVTSGNPANLNTGIFIIVGASACRSAKKRKFGDAKNSLMRKTFERFSIFIIIITVLLQDRSVDRIYTEPVTNLIVPLWVIIAYLIVELKRKKACQNS